jgi:ABC-type branched-subunit amino acid transport system substrate-binding protein
VCVGQAASTTCAQPSTEPLHIGMTGPITGPSQEVGVEMRRGLVLAVDEQNAAGGIHGRQLILEFRDDQATPTATDEETRNLLDVQPAATPRCPVSLPSPAITPAVARGPNAVLSLVGAAGVTTPAAGATLAGESGSLFFGAMAGDTAILRDGALSPACSQYIFNVRASYAMEARAAVEHFLAVGVPDDSHIFSFDQNDGFGQAGYVGVVAAYTALKGAPSRLVRLRYTRDDQTSVPAQVAAATSALGKLLAADAAPHTVGVFLTSTYGPATSFILGVRQWQYANDAEQKAVDKAHRLTLLFENVSAVIGESLAQRVAAEGTVATPDGPKPFSDGVFISQVVPSYDDTNPVVQQYRALLGGSPTLTSLEGYLTGKVFIAGLLAHQGLFTPDALVSTFETMVPLDLGFGATPGFSATRHDWSRSIFGTELTPAGAFTPRYVWTEGQPIQLTK